MYPDIPVLLVNPSTNKPWNHQPYMGKINWRKKWKNKLVYAMPPCNEITGANGTGNAFHTDAQYIAK